MKKLILIAAWVLIHVTAFAQTTQKAAASASNFTNPENIFMIIGIILIGAMVLIPVYSMSRAVNVLAQKAGEK
jgi:hypothetical protein